MKKYVLIAFALALALSSCVTQQKCYEKFPPVQHDSIVTVISYVDTVIYDTIIIPAGVVSIHDTIPCPELEYNKEVSKGGLKHTITIHKGVLNSTCKADSLVKVIDNLIKQKVTLTRSINKQFVEVKTNELTKLQSFWVVCGYLFWIAIIVLAISFFARKYLNSL